MATAAQALSPLRPGEVLRDTLSSLIDRLPSSWTRSVEEAVRVDGRLIDAVVDFTLPDGLRTVLAIEARTNVQAVAVPRVARDAIEAAALVSTEQATATPVLVARYLSPPVRAALVEEGIGYADLTGNVFIQIDRPAVFIRDVGADRDPWRGPGRPRGNLRGATGIRLARALADFAGPCSVPELAKRSGASVGATYRMVEFLEQEGLITREPRAPITGVDWRGILERRGAEAGTQQTQRMSLYLEPRGIPELLTKLRTSRQRYVLTGSLAARYYDEAVPPRLAMLFADPVEPLIEELGLRPSPSGNVLVGVPENPVVFERAQNMAGLWVAAPSQAALDLLAGPGRGPSEAVMLLDWMERNPDAWRQ